jgi:putative hydrolase
MTVLAGVEAKILNRRGRLDLPVLPRGIDLVLIADHQFPGGHGPAGKDPRPAAGRRACGRRGDRLPGRGDSGCSYAGPVLPLIAHLFSVLPKMGLDESQVPAEMLDMLAGQLRRAGALVEVHEKWGCPSARTAAVLAGAGVRLVASTDSHDCADIGVYTSVRHALDAAAGGILR